MKRTTTTRRRPPREPVLAVGLLVLVFAAGCNAEARRHRGRPLPPPAPVQLQQGPAVVQVGPGAERADWSARPPAQAKAGDVDFSETVKGRRMKAEADARKSALEAALGQLIDYVRNLDPPVEWTPEMRDVQKLVREVKVEEETIPDPEIGKVYFATARLVVTTADRAELLQKGRDYRMAQRQLFLAKLVGGLVAVLALVAGYIRVDEWSKGYYTCWLRRAAVVAAVVVVVLLLVIG